MRRLYSSRNELKYTTTLDMKYLHRNVEKILELWYNTEKIKGKYSKIYFWDVT